jgi:radical SAM superfamily enzyme YgiQ (UPF0313 family)
MSWNKEKPNLEDSIQHILSWRGGGGRTCFLGDADSLILKPNFLHEIMGFLKNNFPTLDRFTIYGRTRTAAQVRTVEELKEFRRAGIDRVHFGLESGSDKVLALVDKGVTGKQQIEGCLKVKEAGLSCSVYIMPGLGGSGFAEEHALETSKVLNAIEPDYVRLRTLDIISGTPLEEMNMAGTFRESTEEEIAGELKILIENITCNTELLSDSAANLLDLYGILPGDRVRLLNTINAYLAMSSREKLEFSFYSRLRSFIGQFGDLNLEIISALNPYISETGSINIEIMNDDAISSIIRLIRSRLIP